MARTQSIYLRITASDALPTRVLYGSTAAVALLLAVYFLTKPFSYYLGWLGDDSFYYFTIARNWTETGVPTFDGINKTNGSQPLWQLLVTLPYFFTSDDIFPLRIISSLQAILWASVVISAFTLVFRLTRNTWLAAASSAILLHPHYVALMTGGMENTLAALAILLFILVVVRDVSLTQTTLRGSLVAGLLATLLLASRLDLIFLLIAYSSYLIFIRIRSPRLGSWRNVMAMLAVPTAAILAYVSMNVLVFDGLIGPVSGHVKTGFSVENLFEFEMWTKQLDVTWGWNPGFNGTLLLLVLPVGAVTMLVASIPAARRRCLGNGLHLLIIGILTAAYAMQLLSYHLFFELRAVGGWSLVLPIPLAVLLLAYFGDLVLVSKPMSRILLWPISRPRIFRAVIVSLGALVVMFIGAWLFINEPTSDVNHHMNKYLVAKAIDEFDDGLVAMGDGAGSLGYFTNRNVIHIEGLVNDREFADYLKTGRVHDYLELYDVRYLVATTVDDEVFAGTYEQKYREEPYRKDWEILRSEIPVTRQGEVYRDRWMEGRIVVIWELP